MAGVWLGLITAGIGALFLLLGLAASQRRQFDLCALNRPPGRQRFGPAAPFPRFLSHEGDSIFNLSTRLSTNATTSEPNGDRALSVATLGSSGLQQFDTDLPNPFGQYRRRFVRDSWYRPCCSESRASNGDIDASLGSNRSGNQRWTRTGEWQGLRPGPREMK